MSAIIGLCGYLNLLCFVFSVSLNLKKIIITIQFSRYGCSAGLARRTSRWAWWALCIKYISCGWIDYQEMLIYVVVTSQQIGYIRRTIELSVCWIVLRQQWVHFWATGRAFRRNSWQSQTGNFLSTNYYITMRHKVQ